MKLHTHLASLLWAHAALAAPATRDLSKHRVSIRSASVETLFSVPGTNSSWLENLAIRPSKDTILATRLDVPQLWSIDISTGAGTELLLGDAVSSVSLVGITQLLSSSSSTSARADECEEEEEEVYYIAGVNYTATSVQPNSSVLYSLTYHDAPNSSSPSYTFQKALPLPQMTLINGLTAWSPTVLLATDSYQGAIYKIDVTTGEASILLQDPTMSTNSSTAGINGVKVLRPAELGHTGGPTTSTTTTTTYIYYTNTDQALVARIPVDPQTAELLSTASTTSTAVEVLASGNKLLGGPDDFALLADGGVMVATGAANTVVRVGLDGSVTSVAGSEGDLELASSTACRFGQDGRVLYVTTAGGAEGLVNGTAYGPGSVVAVTFGEES